MIMKKLKTHKAQIQLIITSEEAKLALIKYIENIDSIYR
jgi:hypothetical protein